MRVANWSTVLGERIEAWRGRAFAWGTADCCAFVADVTTAISGESRRELFPAYETEAEALALLAEHEGMVGLLTRAFGQPKAVAFAQRGDVVAIDCGHGLAACICVGAASCAIGPAGMVFVPTSNAVAAWSI